MAMQALAHFAERSQQQLPPSEFQSPASTMLASNIALEDLLLYLSTYRRG